MLVLRSFPTGASAVRIAILSGFCLLAPSSNQVTAADARPLICSLEHDAGQLVISAHIPAGFRHIVLEQSTGSPGSEWEPLVAGPLNGDIALATFRVAAPESRVLLLRTRVGESVAVPSAPFSGAQFLAVTDRPDAGAGDLVCLTGRQEKVGHLLNRVAYGPSASDLERVDSMGIAAYIEEQLHPETISEEDEAARMSAEEPLFREEQPAKDTRLIRTGDIWTYFKGSVAPPSTWNRIDFDDSRWLTGATGIGYGDNDDETELDDMRRIEGEQAGYLSVFLRREFYVADPAAIENLILRVDYDDGFVAYLNGREVARSNISGFPPAYNREADDNHEAGLPEDFDLSRRVNLLRQGTNLLAIQVHNLNITSSDLSMIPELLDRQFLPGPPVRRIAGLEELKQLIHLRGVYTRRQLQTVLAEFWENHFTTDADKVAEYLDDLDNSDATDAIGEGQAYLEAAHMEYREYEFFHENALGNFGDLLLYSATSPTQIIYLDNVLNLKAEPNENYSREILELYAFGVDNRYTQRDIEELARCFTGWTVRKVWPDQTPAFPASARQPPTNGSVMVDDDPIVEVGARVRYFKGSLEPSPGLNGEPTLAWTAPDFNDTRWLIGATSVGYGDDDDRTILADMRNRYASIYLRHLFTVDDPSTLENLVLDMRYDDGFVAYLNGVEVARSETMVGLGAPPRFNRTAQGNHEVEEPAEGYSLAQFQALLKPAPERNCLAIQVHNVSFSSSDLSIHPRLVQRRQLPGSIENGEPSGIWTFRFNPDEHDTGSKILFRGTPQAMSLPANRTGVDGVLDAIDVIDAMVDHPSTREFICIKLINRFVSDEISLEAYHDRRAPSELLELTDAAIAAWQSTRPAGNIETVMRAILDPVRQRNAFWSERAFQAKIKTPIEFVNSTLRALDSTASGAGIPESVLDMGMEFFTRDDPDGWSEIGRDWIDTGTLLKRIDFAQELGSNGSLDMSWDLSGAIAAHGWTDAQSIIDHFDKLLFHGTLPEAHRRILTAFADTDSRGNPRPLDPRRSDFERRVSTLVGLILSLPHWQYQ